MTPPFRDQPVSIAGGVLHASEPARLALASLPTPIESIRRLPARHGIDRPIHLKRDDRTGLGISGNKVRKLEYLVADARARGCDTLVTHGGFQSNHCRAAAAIGARLGMAVRLFLRHAGDTPPAPVGNLLLDGLFGAELSFHPPEEYNHARDALVERTLWEQRAKGRTPYFFPVGGSVPLGSWGYIRAMVELSEQMPRGRAVEVYCAVGSCGTHAGCILGRALLGLERWRVIGIPVAGTAQGMARETRLLVDDTIERFGLGLTAGDTPVEVLDGFVGPGYAIPSPEGLRAIRDAARLEGLVLDPSYTGKAMAGVMHAMRSGHARPDADVVFLHTGGAFGLMAAADQLA